LAIGASAHRQDATQEQSSRARTDLLQGADGLLFRPWLNVRRDLASACKRVGIPWSPRTTKRRPYATWWRHHGVATADIASLLGHKDSRMVERV
jgi:hypothetical protein